MRHYPGGEISSCQHFHDVFHRRDSYGRLHAPFLSGGRTVLRADQNASLWNGLRIWPDTHILLTAAVAAPLRRKMLRMAYLHLVRHFPDMSAAKLCSAGQKGVFLFLLAALVVAAAFWPQNLLHLWVSLSAVGFLAGAVLRLMQLGLRTSAPGSRPAGAPLASDAAALPAVTVLAPLYHEAAILPALVRSMRALDYPRDRLRVLLLTEEGDAETCKAALDCAGDALFSVLPVPAGGPRTKPKACNYALPLVQSEFVVVFDAEDRPEPDQLRRAVAAFRAAPEVMCFQARLDIDRPGKSLISRLFALDYRVWYGTVLPGLSRLGFTIPLGGSSNYFRTEALRKIGGWDAYNVTEDADLGMRMARFGCKARVFDGVTHEDAPACFSIWLKQRTRWIKGYMQTLLVHLRHPLRFAYEAGWSGSASLVFCMGGTVVGSLSTPLLWLLFFLSIGDGAGDGAGLWLPALICGGANFLVNILLVCRAAYMQRPEHLGHTFPIALLMPFYWTLFFIAAWRAALQLCVRPYLWEKTPHFCKARHHATG